MQLSSRHKSWFVVAVGLLVAVATVRAQTNALRAGHVATGSVEMVAGRLPVPSDFQRLQYYYAAQATSPVPGSERAVFTLKADRTWSGDWNSKVVPKPTRAQLTAITAQQVDLFRRAAKYSNGAWRVGAGSASLPLATLGSVDAATYEKLRLSVEREKLQQKVQQLDQKLQQLTPAKAAE